MILINSAAYIIPELRSEVGLLPPCFLPFGNKKLVEHQVDILRKIFKYEEIIISLPGDYELNVSEKNIIKKLKLTPIFIPNGFSLGEAVLNALTSLDIAENETVRLLHGDTLITDIPTESDVIALSIAEDNYSWEFDSQNRVWCGFFSFSSYKKLIQSLTQCQCDFINSIKKYAENQNNIKRVEVKGWYDCGHVNTYFKSRSSITTARAFNDLRIRDRIVRKSGSLHACLW